ncbi:MAG: DUF480 domain-containing protein [Xanthomonadales bacterium]|nr:DUF480 domain-containing protein [Xanthomonadales bacterium]
MTETDVANTSHSSDSTGLPVLLDPAQARVLACLIEKEATTPEQYPLTANAVQVACNQKTARDPVMALEPGQVGHALRTLENEKLVRAIHGARVQRYDHRTDDVYAISPDQRYLLALLVLRGPQTAAELLTRSERLHRYGSTEEVRQVLERLESRQPALVKRLPRASGQREDRYLHLLCGPVHAQAAAERIAASSQPMADDGGGGELAARVAVLEAEVADLRQRLDELAARSGSGG